MLFTYSADRADVLAGRLAEVYAESHPDPMVPEWLAVPSLGMRRWLALELARRLGASPQRTDGVMANTVLAFPADLRHQALDSGCEGGGGDPWRLDRLVWSVLAATDPDPVDDDATARSSIKSGTSRYARARRVADLFDRYHLHRPEMVRAWAAGADVDGTGRQLSDHARWQPALWRRVRALIGHPSPSERWPGLLDDIRSGRLMLDLPPRLAFFGFTMLPVGGCLDLAAAVGVHHRVHFFLLQPTQIDRRRLLEASSPVNGGETSGRSGGLAPARLRTEDRTAALLEQPLLRSWGQAHREAAVLLARAEGGAVPAPEHLGESPTKGPAGILEHLQRSIRSNQLPGKAATVRSVDASIRFHACFGPTRQVEVLHDALLHLLNQPGADVTEDDILVVCPSLERFAPLIGAVFGAPDGRRSQIVPDRDESGSLRGAHSIRYRIADQSTRVGNPVLSSTSALLKLVSGRMGINEVLEFLALAPVRSRFSFDDEALADIDRWAKRTGVCWGLDPEHRSRFGLPDSLGANTWQWALDRILIGSAVDDDQLALAIGGVAPFGIEGLDAELAGRFAEALGRIADLVREVPFARPVEEWMDLLQAVCRSLFATDRSARWQTEALDRLIDDVSEASTVGEVPAVPIEFSDVARVFEERVDRSPGSPDYFRGGITVTSMTPLRWVPYKAIFILGMDQDAFSPTLISADDLASIAPQIGDPDPRAELKAALLEAVLSASEQLVVFYDGWDVRTNLPIPKAVVAAELFDTVLEQFGPDTRSTAAVQLEIRHPRQAFDDRNFIRGELVADAVWSFDEVSLEGALAARSSPDRREQFLARPLEPIVTRVIGLDDLHRFLRDPAGTFLTQRLEVHLPESGEAPSARLRVELNALERWKISTRLLEACRSGRDLQTWARSELARGTLPPAALGAELLDELIGDVESLVAAARTAGAGASPAVPYEVDVTLTDGTRVMGSVPLGLEGPVVGPAVVTCSRDDPMLRIRAWLDLMVLTASDPTVVWRAVTVARPSRGGDAPVVHEYNVVDSEDPAGSRKLAIECLGVAVDCYERGMREPIPLFPRVAAEIVSGGHPASAWSDFHRRGAGDRMATKMIFGDRTFEEMLHLASHPGDPQVEGASGRLSSFAHYLFDAIDRSIEDASGSRRVRSSRRPRS